MTGYLRLGDLSVEGLLAVALLVEQQRGEGVGRQRRREERRERQRQKSCYFSPPLVTFNAFISMSAVFMT